MYRCGSGCFFNICNYYGALDLAFDQYSIRFGSVQTRVFFGNSIQRMNGLFGRGPGAEGGFYFVLGVAALFSALFIIKNRVMMVILLLSSLFSIYASYLTASLSIVLAFILISIAVYLYSRKSIKAVIAVVVPIILTILLLLGLSVLDIDFADIDKQSLFVYFVQEFLDRALDLLERFEGTEYLFGLSLALRTGHAVLPQSMYRVVSIDISWMVIAVKFGIVGLLLVIFLYAKYFKNYLNLDHKKFGRNILILTGILFFGGLAEVHSSPMIFWPFDFICMLSLAVIFYFSNRTESQADRTEGCEKQPVAVGY